MAGPFDLISQALGVDSQQSSMPSNPQAQDALNKMERLNTTLSRLNDFVHFKTTTDQQFPNGSPVATGPNAKLLMDAESSPDSENLLKANINAFRYNPDAVGAQSILIAKSKAMKDAVSNPNGRYQPLQIDNREDILPALSDSDKGAKGDSAKSPFYMKYQAAVDQINDEKKEAADTISNFSGSDGSQIAEKAYNNFTSMDDLQQQDADKAAAKAQALAQSNQQPMPATTSSQGVQPVQGDQSIQNIYKTLFPQGGSQ